MVVLQEGSGNVETSPPAPEAQFIKKQTPNSNSPSKRKRPRKKSLTISAELKPAISQRLLHQPAVSNAVEPRKNRRSKKKEAAVQKLPIDSIRDQFVQNIQQHQVVIVEGEPGSGKSTRLPQFLFKDVFGSRGKIICAEPRRMAARTLADRVAEEMGTKVGDLVGYRVRFEGETSTKTAITFVTDGVLLRELESDPMLQSYSAVFLDDVHERKIEEDLLMALLKPAMAKRPDLKIVIASATLETKKFQEYFSGAPKVDVPGFSPFPVQIIYKDDETDFDYVEATIETVLKIHKSEQEGDILVFLTGEDDITYCCEYLVARDEREELWILPCYSALPLEDLSLVFEKTPPKYKRKVVVATNIAEVSITIDGIVFVIDAGFVKQKTYNPSTRMTSLMPTNITKVQAKQRAGRVGRTQPGVVYRLYGKHVYKNMKKTLKPEVQRSNLEGTVLTMAAHHVEDFHSFNFMDPPPKEEIDNSIVALQELGALDTERHLTQTGTHMARFPLEPRLSKTLLTSRHLRCSEEMLTIASIMSANSSGKKVFYKLGYTLQDCQGAMEAGDHIAYLAAYKIVFKHKDSRNWCYWNKVNFWGLQEALLIRNQLAYILKTLPEIDSAQPAASNPSSSPDNIYKCLLSGYFRNVAHKDKVEKGVGAEYKRYPNKKKNQCTYIHPSSALFKFSAAQDWVLYDEVVMNKTKPYMRNVCPFKPEWIQELVPEFYEKFRSAFPPKK